MFKRDKYADLRIGVKNLCSGHKVSGIDVIFDFLVAYSTHLENELTKILQDKTGREQDHWKVAEMDDFSELWNCEMIRVVFFRYALFLCIYTVNSIIA